MKEKLIKNKFLIVLIIILILQVGFRIFLGTEKNYFHIDEMYSYGLIQYEDAFIEYREDLKNNWHNSQYFKDYLDIDRDKMWDFSAVYENQVLDVHPPLYYLLLRISATIGGLEFNKWSGILLNTLIFIFSSIILYLISNKIFKNKWYSIITCLVFGFTLFSMEITMFIRMYELLMLNVLLLIYYHLMKYKEEKLKFKDLAILFVLVLTGFLTHYYYVIAAFLIAAVYGIYNLIKKNWSNIAKYVGTIIAAAATGLLIFPAAIKHVFNDYRGTEAIEGFLGGASEYISFLKEYLMALDKAIFNNGFVLFVAMAIIVVVICLIRMAIKRKLIKLNETDKKLIIIPIMAILYLLIISKIIPYSDAIRYASPILPMVILSIIYWAKRLLEYILNEKAAITLILIVSLLFTFFNLVNYDKIGIIMRNVQKQINRMEIDKDKPCIYFCKDNMKYMMRPFYTFTQIKETYFIDIEEASKERVQEILKDKNIENGISIMLDKDTISDENLEKVKEYVGLYNLVYEEELWEINRYVLE